MSAVAVREYSVVREPSAPARVGYVVAVLVNAGLLYVAENLLAWNVPYVTEDWVAVLWAVRLSLVAGLAANAMYVAYDAAWFRHLTGIGTGALALLSMVITYAVFPFDLPLRSSPKSCSWRCWRGCSACRSPSWPSSCTC